MLVVNEYIMSCFYTTLNTNCRFVEQDRFMRDFAFEEKIRRNNKLLKHERDLEAKRIQHAEKGIELQSQASI